MFLQDIFPIAQKLQVGFNSYLYSNSFNDNLKSLFIEFEKNKLATEKIDIIYPKLRRLILLSILRYKNIFSFDTSTGIMLFKDLVTQYIIDFFSSIGRNVATTVDENFADIFINDDNTVGIYDSNEFGEFFFNKEFEKIKFVKSDGSTKIYTNTTFVYAVTSYLSEIFLTWNLSLQEKFIAYKDTFISKMNNLDSVNFIKYTDLYEFQILDSINNLLKQVFIKDNYYSVVDKIFNPYFSDDNINNRSVTDLTSILTGDYSNNDQVLKILASGQFLDNFNIRNFQVDEFIEILKQIPNLNVDINLSFSISIDADNNSFSMNIYDELGSYSITKQIITFEQQYQHKIDSLNDVVKRVHDTLLSNISLALLKMYNNLSMQDYVPKQDVSSLYNELFGYISDKINTIDYTQYTTNVDEFAVSKFLDTYDASLLFSNITKYFEDLKVLLNDINDTVYAIFIEQIQRYTPDLVLKFEVNLVNILVESTIKELQRYQNYLKNIMRYLDLGYLVYDFNNRFPEFVKIINSILEPVLKIPVESTSYLTTDFLNKIKELIYIYVDDVLSLFYFDVFSNHNIIYDENTLYTSYTKYPTTNYSLQDFEYTILSGNRAIVYKEELLQYIIEEDSQKYILDLNKDKIIYQLLFDGYYVDFPHGQYRVLTNTSVSSLFSKTLGYDENIVLNGTKFSRFCDRYSNQHYPSSIFTKIKGQILYNYSSFLRFSPGLGYYLDFSIVNFISSRNLETLYEILVKVNSISSRYNILVSDISSSLIKLKPIQYDIGYYSNFYILPITVYDILNGDNENKYVIDVVNKIINTEPVIYDNTPILDEYLLKYIPNIKRLDILDNTGFNGFNISYIYRLLRTYEKLITYDFENMLQYEIVQTSNLFEMSEILKNSKKSKIFERVVGIYKKVE